jgi:hypothetical protein
MAADLRCTIPTGCRQLPDSGIPTCPIRDESWWEDRFERLPVHQAFFPRELRLHGRLVEAMREAVDELVRSKDRFAKRGSRRARRHFFADEGSIAGSGAELADQFVGFELAWRWREVESRL